MSANNKTELSGDFGDELQKLFCKMKLMGFELKSLTALNDNPLQIFQLIRFIQRDCPTYYGLLYDFRKTLKLLDSTLLQQTSLVVDNFFVQPPPLPLGTMTVYSRDWSAADMLEFAKQRNRVDPHVDISLLEELYTGDHAIPVAPGYYTVELPAFNVPGIDLHKMILEYGAIRGFQNESGDIRCPPMAIVMEAILLHLMEDNGREFKSTEYFNVGELGQENAQILPGVRNGCLSFKRSGIAKPDCDVSLSVLRSAPTGAMLA